VSEQPRSRNHFWRHLLRGIAYGIGVTVGFLIVMATLGLLVAGALVQVIHSNGG